MSSSSIPAALIQSIGTHQYFASNGQFCLAEKVQLTKCLAVQSMAGRAAKRTRGRPAKKTQETAKEKDAKDTQPESEKSEEKPEPVIENGKAEMQPSEGSQTEVAV